MAGSVHVDGIILGAGITGLSCAEALLQKRKTCVVLDPNEIGYGASCSPGMLVNPATGRRARKAWKAKKCFNLISDVLHRVQAEFGQTIFETSGVIRPALTKKLSKNFEQSPGKYEWPDGWIEWLPKDEFSKQFPVFKNHFGGLFVRNAMTVNGNLFIKAFAEYLDRRDIHILSGINYDLQQFRKKWEANLANSQTYEADFVIDATGYQQVKSEEWNMVPLHPVKGQTATFFFDEPLPFKTSVSSLGYMAFIKDQPNQITVGSTYEHNFTHLKPDENGLNYLKKKLDTTFPGLIDKSISIEQWSGVRVSIQDKKPVIGPHPDKKGLYMIGALGSKGLLMGRFMADTLVEHILNGSSIEKTISIERFL
ncbi:NAD(P)/FAD-dependent oxidoreductase [Rhodohalobacter sp. 614A]|uniref:NAD(P)/FAD-dependent oxidoreductase n=1 Tax=Rhodohalobacter sp. 614A TaxID=2908649 RepID=UPI001F3A0772